jgi:hypothetical protein
MKAHSEALQQPINRIGQQPKSDLSNVGIVGIVYYGGEKVLSAGDNRCNAFIGGDGAFSDLSRGLFGGGYGGVWELALPVMGGQSGGGRVLELGQEPCRA